MPLLAQLCLVVVTIAVVALAVMAIRLMLRTQVLIETTTRSLGELPSLIEEAKRLSSRGDELLVAFSGIARSVQSGASQLETLSTRTGSMTTRLLDEVERPLADAIGVMRGLRTGAGLLFRRWQARFDDDARAPSRGDRADEERWSDDGGSSPDHAGRPRAGTEFHDYGG